MNSVLRPAPTLIVAGLLMETVWIGLLRVLQTDLMSVVQVTQVMTLISALAALCALYGSAYLASRWGSRPDDRTVIIFFAALFAATLLISGPPRTSTDAAGYVFYGRTLSVYGQNTYAVVPRDRPQDPIIPYICPCWMNWPNPYGPGWTAIMAAVTALSARGDAVFQMTAFKAVGVLFYFGCLLLIWFLTRGTLGFREDQATRALLLFAWNPVVLFETIQNGHNDLVMIFFVLLTAALLAARKTLAAGAAFGLSLLMKYITAAALPLMLVELTARGAAPRPSAPRRVLKFAAGLALVSLPLAAWLWNGGTMLTGLANQSGQWDYTTVSPFIFAVWLARPLFSTATPAVWMSSAAQPAAALAFTLFLTVLTIRMIGRPATPRRLIRYTLFCLAGYLLIYSSWMMTWYAIWLIPLFILLDDLTGLAVASVASAAAYLIHPLPAAASGAFAYLFLWSIRKAAALVRRLRRSVR